MKKSLSILLAGLMIVMLLAACNNSPSPTSTPTPTPTPTGSNATPTPTPDDSEIVNGKFVDKRSISVEIYDRSNDGGSPPDNNFYTDYIKAGMLDKHNVEVSFVTVPRWTEDQAINNLLAASSAPDVCVTYNYPAVLSYANMGGIIDLAPLIEENWDLIPNLVSTVTEQNLYWNKDPEKGTIWAIEARLAHLTRINTFVRSDWLSALNIPEPKSLAEFEAMLYAFKDNASTLLGSDAGKMIPFSTSYDIGWRGDHLIAAFYPDEMTEKEGFIYGFDDRHLLYPGFKDGVKKLNEWYNNGLIWNDFPLYGAGDPTEDNLMKSGYVGSFIHNWDYPYRNGDDSIINNIKRNVGPDANYTAVTSFENNAGRYMKALSNPIDRKVFFPTTNKEPVASMLYLDWISTFENTRFLQIGEEGVTHEITPDGAIKILAVQGEKIMNSGSNIDYTITLNGLKLDTEELTIKSLALNYPGIDAAEVSKAYNASLKDGRIFEYFNVGEVKSEEGMATPLKDKRDAFLTQAVVAKTDNFDSVYDGGMNDYLSSGGQAIIDERTQLFSKFYE